MFWDKNTKETKPKDSAAKTKKMKDLEFKQSMEELKARKDPSYKPKDYLGEELWRQEMLKQ